VFAERSRIASIPDLLAYPIVTLLSVKTVLFEQLTLLLTMLFAQVAHCLSRETILENENIIVISLFSENNIGCTIFSQNAVCAMIVKRWTFFSVQIDTIIRKLACALQSHDVPKRRCLHRMGKMNEQRFTRPWLRFTPECPLPAAYWPIVRKEIRKVIGDRVQNWQRVCEVARTEGEI